MYLSLENLYMPSFALGKFWLCILVFYSNSRQAAGLYHVWLRHPQTFCLYVPRHDKLDICYVYPYCKSNIKVMYILVALKRSAMALLFIVMLVLS